MRHDKGFFGKISHITLLAVAALAASVYFGGGAGCGGSLSSTVGMPTVITTVPANAATNVPLNRRIAVAFSEAMNPATITTKTFILRKGYLSVAGTVDYSGVTAVFTPSSNLVANTLYTATITTGAKDLAGNSIVAKKVWTFTTGSTIDTVAPTVSSVVPLNAATGVSLNMQIAATFSKGMNPLMVTTSTFLLTGPGTTPVTGTVGYVLGGNVAIFTPSANLAASTLYTATITTGAKGLSGNALASNFVWTFTTGTTADTTAPTVSSTTPLTAATGVALNMKIAAAFSEAMDPVTITTSTFTVTGPGTTAVSGTVDYALVGSVPTFTPDSNLAASTLYTATITTGVEDLTGNALASNYVWTFTTGTTADTTLPTVSSVVPLNAATGVSLNMRIAASFSEVLDPLTITNLTYVITGPGTTAVAGTVAFSLAGNVATFIPSSNLTASTLYTATLTTEVADLAGNALASNYAWTFTTGTTSDSTAPTVSSTDPIDVATGVAINSAIAATFSEVMDSGTTTTATFLLTGPGTTPVAGSVAFSLVGNIATFTPTSNLTASTLYTATVTTGVADLAGNALAANKVWTFTTGATADTTAPLVSSTNPADAITSVALNKAITATFDSAMKASTITTDNYTLTGPGVTPVVGTVAYDLITHVVTFTPGSNLTGSTLYTATITTGVQDLANNALATNKVWTFTTGTEAAQTVVQEAVPLGSTSTFAILAQAAITNIPTSIITGDVATSPIGGASITGFNTPASCPEVTGTMYKTDAGGPACATNVGAPPNIISIAQDAALAAYLNAVAAARGTAASISGNINGLTLYPGLYESGTSIEISAAGHLYLDAQGDANAIFVIRSATTITTSATSEVHLTHGAKANNVYWTAGSSVTLGVNSIMKGTMIASTALTLQTGANLEGRALNQGAAATAISCDTCTITVPSP